MPVVMFIAHLPAGYLLTRGIQKITGTTKYLWVGLVASVLPDFDMFYFYLVDHRQTLHHEYVTHMPLFWLALWAVWTLLLFRRRDLQIAGAIFFGNVLLHCVLDTFVGGIAWLAPFNDHATFLVTVPARYDFWVWNFVLHWTFGLEVAIIIAAVVLFFVERKKTSAV